MTKLQEFEEDIRSLARQYWGVEQKVFIIQHKQNMSVLGCFGTREDAEKYIGDSDCAILEIEIAKY